MSAYPHSPLREFVLGGVSRFMLEHADLPLLMRHWQGRTGPGR
ncbi:universal stress protein [Roseomonas mucosa]|nr:universal stress protein [Roseomonas mucosa]